MRALALTLLAASVMAACSPGEGAKGPAGEAPAALPPGRPAIYQAATEGPEPFVRAIYAAYVSGAGLGEPPQAGRDPLLGRTLNALIGADVAKHAGEVPTVNYDIFCGCQDGGAFTLDSVTMTQVDRTHAEAAVAFTNAGEPKRQTLKLEREGLSWKVVDVLVPGEAPLTDTLYKAIE
ncbi:MAG TPA: DUF3828 domain-containing protein [Caulobacteraceae bacterium]|jgi:hypothetical protein